MFRINFCITDLNVKKALGPLLNNLPKFLVILYLGFIHIFEKRCNRRKGNFSLDLDIVLRYSSTVDKHTWCVFFWENLHLISEDTEAWRHEINMLPGLCHL